MSHNRIAFSALVFIAALGTTSCATPLIKHERFSELSPPLQGESLVYFYRADSFGASGVLYDVLLDGKAVANLANCTFSPVRTAPGEYKLSTISHPSMSADPKPSIATLKPGARQFYLLATDSKTSGYVMAGAVIPVGIVNLSWLETTEEQALPLLKSCQRVQLDSSTGG